MFNPNGSNNEFIEIYNLSASDSIDLSGFKIIYATNSADLIVPLAGSIIPPQCFAIIFEGDYNFISGIYNSIVPANAIQFKLNNSAFGASGMANTSDRTLYLINKNNDTVDVYTYSANNSTGKSDEKKILSKNNSSQNWANSIDINGTPGKYNSVSPKQNNISITSISFFPSRPKLNDTLLIKTIIKNNGVNSQYNFPVELYYDVNKDTIFTADELISTKIISELLSNDSLEIQFEFIVNEINHFNLAVVISVLNDEEPSDNQKMFEFDVAPADARYNDLVINEIMYSPQNDEPEWIEIYNRTPNSIDLINWTIKDKTTKVKLSNSSLKLASDDYLIITKDISITNFYESIKNFVVINLPTLNNTGDEIILQDANNNVIDSVAFNPNWGGDNGTSLERIDVNSSSNDSLNWSASRSIKKATPCAINSISLHQKDLIIFSISEPKKYYQSGDAITLSIKIKNIGSHAINSFSLITNLDLNSNNIIDVGEEKSQQDFLLDKPLEKDDTISIKLSYNNYQLGKNNLIIRLVVDDEEYSENNLAFTSVNVVEINVYWNDLVINEIMYSPSSGQPEWIEIYNRSQKQINIKNFQIADNSSKSRIESKNFFVNPEDYLVISKDSSLTSNFDIQKLIVANFPSLNNSADKVIILDSLNRTIDSVYYYSTWGGSTGKSLERIDAEKSSNDKNNWGTCTDLLQATPGKQNAISIKNFDIELSTFDVSPKIPHPGSELKFVTVIKNVGRRELTFTVDLYEQSFVDSTQKILLAKSDLISISPNDSAMYEFNTKKILMGQPIKFCVEISSDHDENIQNNRIEKIVFAAFESESFIINEIMFAPMNGEPEWFELFNKSEYDIDLLSFSVSDVLTTPSKNIMSNKNILIPSGKYIVIAKDSSINYYHNKINSPIIVSKFPNLNNDFDGIVIRDYYGSKIDSVFYSYNWGGKNGYSLERMSINSSSIDSSNWSSSKDLEFSTPGRINSISKKKYDVAISNVKINPNPPNMEEDILISAVVKNTGDLIAENLTINFKIDANEKSQIFHTETIQSLSPNDSVMVVANPIRLSKHSVIIVECVFNLDEDISNNIDSINIYLSSQSSSIVISEFMPYPDAGLPEWIEFYNTSKSAIDITDWKIVDEIPNQLATKITGDNLIINPGEYFVVSTDTNFIPKGIKKFQVKFGSLGNSEDGIILLDANNLMIDSVHYSKSITIKKSKSIERTLFANNERKFFLHYSLSSSGNTLGRVNSIESSVSSSVNDVVINEIMFDPSINNSEFIELYNNSDDSINIGGWQLKDGTREFIDIAESEIIILPRDYFVISSDSLIMNNYLNIIRDKINIPTEWISLTNEKKSLVLCDIFGVKIDSLLYQANWHNTNFHSTKNISLERISPSINSNDRNNWSSSVSSFGATPCEENSIFTATNLGSNKLSIEPNPFSPDNDGFEDFAIISVKTKSEQNQLRIKIFDDKGRLKRNLVDNLPISNSAQIIFDGRDNEGRILNVGMYIALIEVSNSSNKTIDRMKAIIVVARKL